MSKQSSHQINKPTQKYIGLNFTLPHDLNEQLEQLALIEFRSKRKQVEYLLHQKYQNRNHCVEYQQNTLAAPTQNGVGMQVDLSQVCNEKLSRNAAANGLTKKEQITLDLRELLKGTR